MHVCRRTCAASIHATSCAAHSIAASDRERGALRLSLPVAKRVIRRRPCTSRVCVHVAGPSRLCIIGACCNRQTLLFVARCRGRASTEMCNAACRDCVARLLQRASINAKSSKSLAAARKQAASREILLWINTSQVSLLKLRWLALPACHLRGACLLSRARVVAPTRLLSVRQAGVSLLHNLVVPPPAFGVKTSDLLGASGVEALSLLVTPEGVLRPAKCNARATRAGT